MGRKERYKKRRILIPSYRSAVYSNRRMPKLALLVSHPFNKIINNHRPCLIRIIVLKVRKTYLPKVKIH